ncbi:MAG: NYN domain-containing protein [Candidatus Methylomirabilia bacterium]
MRIIDGYNVIGAAAEFGLALSLPDKEVRLLRLLSTFRSRRRSRQPMLVVFDGHYGRLATGPRRYSHLGIQVEWALGETADAVIVRKVRSAARGREFEVVTSDEQVLRAIAGCGAKGLRSREFLAELSRVFVDEPAAEKPAASTPAEVAEWLERFGGGR